MSYNVATITDGRGPAVSALVDGELAFRNHEGGSSDAPDWPVFIAWARRYLRP